MKKGFTLIELLAVILILGIIALIAIPQVTEIYEELLTLGCGNYTCKNSEYSWVYQTSYLSGSADDDYCMWYVYADGEFNIEDFCRIFHFGIRPVITVDESWIVK